MTRRQTIATIEQQDCKDKGDIEGSDCWDFILYAVTVLGIDGMSDEEDDEENGEKVKSVLDVDFRRPEFQLWLKARVVESFGEEWRSQKWLNDNRPETYPVSF
ncbi:hypothetical protein C8R42DRAFT_644923 [Lentinula raphanica]|nr:hypothetical protein C8R42DRAFT_644923 [Lentinula raphanica]